MNLNSHFFVFFFFSFSSLFFFALSLSLSISVHCFPRGLRALSAPSAYSTAQEPSRARSRRSKKALPFFFGFACLQFRLSLTLSSQLVFFFPTFASALSSSQLRRGAPSLGYGAGK
jgi:hypothetical protein